MSTIADAEAIIDRLCGKSSYKRDIVAGRQRFSGSDLAGAARKWGSYGRAATALAEAIMDEFPGARWVGGKPNQGAKRIQITLADGVLVVGSR